MGKHQVLNCHNKRSVPLSCKCSVSPSLSAENKCWHQGTDSAPMWNNLIPLIMLQMLRKLFWGKKAKYGDIQNEPFYLNSRIHLFSIVCCTYSGSVFTFICGQLQYVYTKAHIRSKMTLSFYSMTSDSWTVLGFTGSWISFPMPA